jgi:hypothetical protein
MDPLIKKLKHIEDLLKAFKPMMLKPKNNTLPQLPQVPSIKPMTTTAPVPKAASLPKISPQSNKDPRKVAEQIKSGQQKKMNMPKMEMLKVADNGQWSLEKGAMQRLAPNPKVGGMTPDTSSIRQPSEDKSLSMRGARALAVQHSDNPHAFKTIGGVPHIMLHRGISPKSEGTNPASKMTAGNNGISHDDHGLYTDNPWYADQFGASAENGKTHSVWVPLNAVNRNSHHEGNAHWKKEENHPESQYNTTYADDKKGYEDAYAPGSDSGYEMSSRGNHILVNPGSYNAASPEEVSKYKAKYQENFDSTGKNPSSFEAYSEKKKV